jgi:hypothetical protein
MEDDASASTRLPTSAPGDDHHRAATLPSLSLNPLNLSAPAFRAIVLGPIVVELAPAPLLARYLSLYSLMVTLGSASILRWRGLALGVAERGVDRRRAPSASVGRRLPSVPRGCSAEGVRRRAGVRDRGEPE